MLKNNSGKFVGVSFPAVTIPFIGMYITKNVMNITKKPNSIATKTDPGFFENNFHPSTKLLFPVLSTIAEVIPKK